MISPAQNRFYFGLWGKVVKRLMNGRETWTKAEEDQRRHEFHVEIFGSDKSHMDFTEIQFKTFKRACENVLNAGGLPAVLDAERNAWNTAWFGVQRLMRLLGVDHNYVQGVVDRMDSLGRLDEGPDPIRKKMSQEERDVHEWDRELTRDERPHKILRELTSTQLKKVLISLEQEWRRKQPGWQDTLDRRKEKRAVLRAQKKVDRTYVLT